MLAGSFDYIVVGAGTAGCLVANRLSEQRARRVLLIEAGPRPRNFWVGMPAGVSKLIFPGKLNWGFQTEPEPWLNNRRIYAPRGRGLGGSSLINGMGFYRGQPQDYDGWAAAGLDGWGWDDVVPLYRKFENRRGAGGDRRGRSGELAISDPWRVHPVSAAFIASAKRAGVPANDDFNDRGAEGVGVIQYNIRDGVRHDAARAFLDPVASRPNLAIVTGAQVARVVVDDGAVTGVEVRTDDGAIRTIACHGEVILSAGAFGSPQVLLNSGIGPAAELQAAGVAPLLDLPGVGRNLQDHMYIHQTFGCEPRSSMNGQFRGPRAWMHGVRYLLTRAGPLSDGASQACAFVRSGSDVDRADLQISFRPVSWTFAADGTLSIGKVPEITVSVCHLRPRSRGSVTLAGADPFAAPRIRANYLSVPHDRHIAVLAVRRVREIFAEEPLRSRITTEVAPGAAVQSDEQILDYVQRTAQSMHHWVGTSAMGTDADPAAVVDARLRVRGVRGLRVADTSVLPCIVSANTNGVAFMVAEKLAALMRDDAHA